MLDSGYFKKYIYKIVGTSIDVCIYVYTIYNISSIEMKFHTFLLLLSW